MCYEFYWPKSSSGLRAEKGLEYALLATLCHLMNALDGSGRIILNNSYRVTLVQWLTLKLTGANHNQYLIKVDENDESTSWDSTKCSGSLAVDFFVSVSFHSHASKVAQVVGCRRLDLSTPPPPPPSDYRTTADAIMLSQFTHFYLKVCSTQQTHTHTHAPAFRITLTPIWFLPIFLSLPLSHSLTNTHTLMLLSLITSSTTTPCYSLALCVSLLSLNRHNLKQIKLAHSRRLDCLCVSSGVFAAKWLKTCPP